ncbi:MAG: BON domain-containing protein [Pseudomonadota bacterium]
MSRFVPLPLSLLGTLFLSAALLTGCAVASAGVRKGDERNFVRSLNDVNAGRAVEARLKRAYDYDLKGVDVEVAEGVVLLSGNVPRQEDRIEAARIAWSAPNIDQVGNEIMVKGRQGFVRNTKDGLLEKSVRTRLTADKYVKGRNFNVETHDGIVYLLGVARDPAELDRAARIAAMTRGTLEVVSYVRVHEGAQPTVREVAAPNLRELPDFMTTEPLPDIDRADIPAPMRQAPQNQPVPYATPQTIVPYALGEGYVSDPEAPPYYIDPQTGQQIRVRTQAELPQP